MFHFLERKRFIPLIQHILRSFCQTCISTSSSLFLPTWSNYSFFFLFPEQFYLTTGNKFNSNFKGRKIPYLLKWNERFFAGTTDWLLYGMMEGIIILISVISDFTWDTVEVGDSRNHGKNILLAQTMPRLLLWLCLT